MTRLLAVLVAGTIIAASAPALADPTAEADSASVSDEPDKLLPPPPAPPPSPPPMISTGRRAAAIVASLVPGFALHGVGHWIAKEPRTAKKLAMLELVGATLLGAGGIPLALTYGSDKVTTFAVPLIVAGGGMFLTSWFADLYGAAGAACRFGEARRPARFSVDAGVMYVDDAIFDYGAFVTAGASWRAGRLRLSPSAAIAVDADNQRVRLEAGWKLRRGAGSGNGAGMTPGVLGAGGNFLEVAGAATMHRYGDDGFWVGTAELGLHGRRDLGTLAPSLHGAFAEGSVGFGLDVTHYATNGDDDVNTLALGRFGFGVYLGRGRGELAVHYDHRRDGFAGGLAPGHGGGISRATSFIGSIGLAADVTLAGPWSLTGELTVGSAYVTALSLRYRGGV